MSTFELELLSAADRQAPKLNVFDYVTRLVLPGLALLTVILKKDIPPLGFWAVLAFMFVSFAAGFYHPITAMFRAWRERRTDRRVARSAFPELKKFAHRFEDFIGNHTGTLHYIAQTDVCQGYGQRYNALGLPDIYVWHAYWKHYTDRLDRMDHKRQENILELRYELVEFFDLVGTYSNSCIAALFERMPESERTSLTPQGKSGLNAFQQKFQHFGEEYKNFAKEVSEKRPALNGLPYNFSIPKPIS